MCQKKERPSVAQLGSERLSGGILQFLSCGQRFSTQSSSTPHGAFGNVQTHFWLSQLVLGYHCYPLGRKLKCSPTSHNAQNNFPSPTENYPAPSLSDVKMEKP